MKIALTSVMVTDPIKAYKFYTEVLGFVKKIYMPEGLLAIVVSPEDPEGTALLLEPSEGTFAQGFRETVYEKGLPYLILGVTDCQAEYERLKAKGVKFKQEPTKTDWGTQAIFDDTHGNWIQIHQE